MFVVTMNRVTGTHSYVLGVFYTEAQAKFHANAEMLARAGKYDAYLEYFPPTTTIHSDHYRELGPIQFEHSKEIEEACKKIYGVSCFS